MRQKLEEIMKTVRNEELYDDLEDAKIDLRSIVRQEFDFFPYEFPYEFEELLNRLDEIEELECEYAVVGINYHHGANVQLFNPAGVKAIIDYYMEEIKDYVRRNYTEDDVLAVTEFVNDVIKYFYGYEFYESYVKND